MTAAAVPNDYPDRYLQCPICRVVAGDPCRSRSGRVAGGQPDGVETLLERPHVARKRSARARIIPDGFTEGLGLRA